MSLSSNREIRSAWGEKTPDAKMHHTTTLKRHCEAATIFQRGLSLSDGRDVIRKAVAHSHATTTTPLTKSGVVFLNSACVGLGECCILMQTKKLIRESWNTKLSFYNYCQRIGTRKYIEKRLIIFRASRDVTTDSYNRIIIWNTEKALIFLV